MRARKFILDILLVCLLFAGLFTASSQPYEKQDLRETISRYIEDAPWTAKLDHISFQYAGKEISTKSLGTAGFVEFFIRKATHFLTFSLIAALLYRFLRHFCRPTAALPWSCVISLSAAVLDEWHQTFIPHRTGIIADVILDGSGICITLLIIAVTCVFHHPKQRKKGYNILVNTLTRNR